MRLLLPYNNSNQPRYTNTVSVLTRVIISAIYAIKTLDPTSSKYWLNKLFPSFPVGTIFTRTCKTPINKKNSHSGGVCGFDLDNTTTFANLSPLGNLKIRNKSHNTNDSVVFLRTTEITHFINFVVISQIIGVQIKSGVGANRSSESRGIFSACCPLQNSYMVDLCSFFGCSGIIQTDSVDSLIIDDEIADIQNLAGRAVVEGFAFPVFNDKINSEKSPSIDEVIFPEFAFHSTNLSKIFEYVNVTNANGVTDPIFKYGHPLFRVQNSRNTITSFQKSSNVLIDIFNIDTILKDPKSRNEYLNFQFDKLLYTQPIAVSNIPKYMIAHYARRDLITGVFNNSEFKTMPYLTNDHATNEKLFTSFCQLLTSNQNLETYDLNTFFNQLGAGKKYSKSKSKSKSKTKKNKNRRIG